MHFRGVSITIYIDIDIYIACLATTYGHYILFEYYMDYLKYIIRTLRRER